jgi:aspartate aminotransferase
VSTVSSAVAVRSIVPPSATLAIDERVRARREAGREIVHLGFGEAGLPVLPSVAERLSRAAPRNAYGPVAGSMSVRAAAAGYFARRGLPTMPEQVVAAPGSKALLFGLLSVLPGDVVLPRPSWVSYAAQAALARKRVLTVPIDRCAGGVPDPTALREAVRRGRAAGDRPGVLVLTLPDNPTGTLAPGSLVGEVVEIAAELGLLIVCDEIYRDLAHQPGTICSPATMAPDRVFVTNGLSKSMALGGWRIGFARLPDGPLGTSAGRALTGLASEIWSSLAAPMQHAAAYVLDEPDDVCDHIARSRNLHRRVAVAAHARVVAAGAHCRPPAAGFYLYPDLEPLRPQLARRGITTGAQLADRLLAEHDIAVLPGEAFGDDPAALRFRMATSLLYGPDDQRRWSALSADEPEGLPWIREPLQRMHKALRALGNDQ